MLKNAIPQLQAQEIYKVTGAYLDDGTQWPAAPPVKVRYWSAPNPHLCIDSSSTLCILWNFFTYSRGPTGFLIFIFMAIVSYYGLFFRTYWPGSWAFHLHLVNSCNSSYGSSQCLNKLCCGYQGLRYSMMELMHPLVTMHAEVCTPPGTCMKSLLYVLFPLLSKQSPRGPPWWGSWLICGRCIYRCLQVQSHS